jgi:hypothetical protein
VDLAHLGRQLADLNTRVADLQRRGSAPAVPVTDDAGRASMTRWPGRLVLTDTGLWIVDRDDTWRLITWE